MMFEKMFEPITINKSVFKNRLFIPPMCTNLCNEDGTVTESFIRYHERKAQGGWALTTVEHAVTRRQGKANRFQMGIWDDSFIPGLTKLAERVHTAGGKISAQINHAGMMTYYDLIGEQPVGPSSPITIAMGEQPRELSRDEINSIVNDFSEGALRLKKAGFDMVTVHAHASYLLASFVSGMTNKRTDEYGGCFHNRARIVIEVIQKIRERVGPDFPISVRFNAEEYCMGGLSYPETAVFASMMEQAGADVLDVTVGNCYSIVAMIAPSEIPHGFAVNLASQIKQSVKIPVTIAGRIHDPYMVEMLLKQGVIDFVSIGRGSLAEPDYPLLIQKGKCDDIRYCIGCMQGCSGNVGARRPIACMVNPQIKHGYDIPKATLKKKVLVIGGGVAGMEAAIVAAQRGHEVTLAEKTGKLGGQWLLALIPPTKNEFSTFIIWQTSKLKECGVKVELNTEATVDYVKAKAPDAVIVAAGAAPVMPKIKGIGGKNVVSASVALQSMTNIGRNVVVIGGGLVGAETADHLSIHDRNVTVIEMLDRIARDGQYSTNKLMFKNLEKHHVILITDASVKEIDEHTVSYELDGKREVIKKVNTVVIAVGSKSIRNEDFINQLKGIAKEVITIGDYDKAGDGFKAIDEGYVTGLNI
jgi:2,4-dienoyl-CoA reductase-like NADH-dependent reductase (Old Yellow Enzyme family)